MTKQKYKIHSRTNMMNFFKKFPGIEKSLLFEIYDGKIIAKTHTSDKSVVKIASVLVTDVMDIMSDNEENIKMGLFAIDNFISSFKHFDEEETKLEIEYSTVDNDNISTEIRAISKTLRISFPCASTSMFRYIDQTLADNLLDATDSLFSFRIDKDTLARISALSALDNDNEIITIESKNNEIFFRGKNFELNMTGVTSDTPGKLSFYKSHFSFIDREDSEIFVLDSKVIFKSLETDTNIIIGKVE